MRHILPHKNSNYYKEYHLKHPNYRRDYYLKNKEKFIINYKNFCYRVRENLFNTLGRVCSKCGFVDKRVLQFDHKNGGGREEIRRSYHLKMLTDYMRDYELANQKLQVLCANCNWIKRVESNEIHRGEKYNTKQNIIKRYKSYILRLSLINLLGGECVKCGLEDLRVLHIDHINGGGSKRRLRDTLQTYYLNHCLDATQQLQILCANCNTIKKYENEECSSTNTSICLIKKINTS